MTFDFVLNLTTAEGARSPAPEATRLQVTEVIR